ncbi:MAG: DUF362 domain-containing protein [Candidatus Sabulitectum sp.]|nr:DUF362 domain-containing protein [Candidatus Sabulitectum sp.]
MNQVRFLSKERMNDSGFGELLAPYRLADQGRDNGNDMTAVKIHPGEAGNSSYISASLVKKIIEALDLPGNRTFLTDTTVLYGGRRMTAPDYVTLAYDHGFRMPGLPPFIVADGLAGFDEITIDLPSHCETRTARLASALTRTDNAVMVSHFKGHLLAGFGGSIKHLGMGWATKAGKLYQHSSVMPYVKAEKCTMCNVCLQVCGAEAIEPVENAVRINEAVCTGCGECIQRCPAGAIRIRWDQEAHTFMSRMTEYALAATMATKVQVYVNFLINISPDCDCMKNEAPPMVENIGVLASSDPVAIDQASLDLVNAAVPLAGNASAGEDKFLHIRPERDGREQLRIGEKIGLGKRSYKLVEV